MCRSTVPVRTIGYVVCTGYIVPVRLHQIRSSFSYMYGIQRSFLEYDYGSRAVLDTKGSYEYTVHHSKRRATLCRRFGLARLGLRAGRTTMMCARVQLPCKRNVGSSIATKASTFLGAP
jgi:hypothetical protein